MSFRHKFKIRRSPSHIKHLLPSSVLPMKEIHKYDSGVGGVNVHHVHRPVPLSHFNSHIADNQHSHHDQSYINISGGMIPSRTTTTLLQYQPQLPVDLPPLYQPQHRASI